MRISTFAAALLLPLSLASASTTTYTSTMTKTVTVKRVVATATMTYGVNSTTSYPTGTAAGTGYTSATLIASSGALLSTTAGASPSASESSLPANYMGAASGLRSESVVFLGAMAAVVAAMM
jgi:hypothetical protein